ncbi:MAG TPA: Fic family protein [Virgibacillus sp.]|nr:Fic family protein [Virgibacillus sp.]
MYDYLFKMFHQVDSQSFEEEYNMRFNGFGTTKIPLRIKPYKTNETFTLFYVNTRDLVYKSNKIYQQDNIIRTLKNKLPAIAKQDFINNHIINELYSTNVLEGVQSSRQEIVESTRELAINPHKKVRLKNMIHSYQKLLSGNVHAIKNPEDIRYIYDDLVKDEIVEKHHMLDGKLFREDVTNVFKGSGTGQIIHQGIYPEQRIIEALKELLSFLNNEPNIPLLFKVAIGHYYFGYIHPFYDGNGRTSRFISSVFLQKEFNHLTALSLSNGCNKNKRAYLDAFEQTNSFKNKGELTYFCDVFFDILIDSQNNIIAELKEKDLLLSAFYKSHIQQNKKLTNENQRQILFVIAQNYFFAMDEKGMSRTILTHACDLSEYMIKKETDELIEKNLIRTIKKRPIIYQLNEEYFNLGTN